MTNITRVAIDLAKNVLQVCAADARGAVIWNKAMNRSQLMKFMAGLEPVDVVTESCATANYWARVFASHGHRVKLIHPHYVRPFVKTNKNDAADAEAILEASLRPTMRFVQPKTVEQQDIQMLHRRRERLVKQYTATQNQTRSLLAEYGIIVGRGIKPLRTCLADILDEQVSNNLSPLALEQFLALYEELQHCAQLVSQATRQIGLISRQHPVCTRLMTIPGVGPIIATAIYATLGGSVTQFSKGRDFAAYIGLVPRQHSSGGRQLLLGISKRGDRYLRTLLVQGAQSALSRRHNPDQLSRWGSKLVGRRGRAIAATAMANKLARICWAVMAKQTSYRAQSV